MSPEPQTSQKVSDEDTHRPSLARKPDLTVQCAWCQTILHQGDPTQPVTHGMCPDCMNKFLSPQTELVV